MKVETKSCLKIGMSIFLLFLGIHYWSGIVDFIGAVLGAAGPLLVGCVIAYLINILMSFFERYFFPNEKTATLGKGRRPVCMLAAMMTLMIFIRTATGGIEILHTPTQCHGSFAVEAEST